MKGAKKICGSTNTAKYYRVIKGVDPTKNTTYCTVEKAAVGKNSFQLSRDGLVQAGLAPPRVQYAYIGEPKTPQTIPSHPE
jgi:hypothetical protein